MLPAVRACLVDVYDTILNSDFRARVRALTAYVDVAPDNWLDEWLKTDDDRCRGKLSIPDSFALALEACGITPTPGLVSELVSKDAELLLERAHLYDDTVPFLTGLRTQGIATALVSNCSPSTRPLLEQLGVTKLVDAVVLSCEVGSVKPSPEIYLAALDDLGVAPADAVMIDDQARFCAGAEAVGVRAIQIARPDLGKPVPEAGFPVVRSLADVPALLRGHGYGDPAGAPVAGL